MSYLIEGLPLLSWLRFLETCVSIAGQNKNNSMREWNQI